MARIVHLTSVHPRYDVRIFLKMCRSAAAAGHEVTLIVADGLRDEVKDGVRVVDTGASHGRIDRMLGATRRVLKSALAHDADLYHLHDPELLGIGLVLKRRGKHVIFDAHEDLPRQILSKAYLHPVARRSISRAASILEKFACRRFDAVIAATPTIRDKFEHLGIHSVNISNFPLLDELAADASWARKEKEVCYVGSITAVRGIKQAVEAIAASKSGARLNLAGDFSEKQVKAEVEQMPGWTKTNELGFLSREGIKAVLDRSMVGLVTLHPTPAYLDSLPIKMFEYMAAGLPVVSSNFPLWQKIVEGNECGICVDPLCPEQIASAIDRLIDDPGLARHMGERGRHAVESKYNWTAEKAKLLELYDEVLARA